MSNIKVGFSGLTVPLQIERSRLVQVAMTGNASFPTPLPTLIAVKAATDACEVAFNEAANGDSVKRDILRLRRAEMLLLISLLADYVSNVSAADEETILSSGFAVESPKQPTPPVGQVTNARIVQGNLSGMLIARFNAVKNRKVYLGEISTDITDPTKWTSLGTTTKLKFVITGLTPGTIYWVRVRAIGKSGELGEWSDPATRMVI